MSLSLRARAGAFAASVAVATVALSLVAAPAWAHDELVASSPQQNEQLTVAPTAVELIFSGEIMQMGAAVIVADAQENDWVAGDIQIDFDTLTVTLDEGMPNGAYEVRWRVVSSDGHPISGLIPFTVALAGHYIGGQLSLQLGSLIAPGESTTSQTPSVMLQMITVMLMFSLDIHFELLMGFQQSYNVLTIGGGHLSDALFTEITSLCTRTFVVALRIAAPIIAVGIVVNLLMMVLGRTIPEVNVFIMSFSIRILVGVFLFGFTLSLAAREISNYLKQLPDDFVVVTRLLAGG